MRQMKCVHLYKYEGMRCKLTSHIGSFSHPSFPPFFPLISSLFLGQQWHFWLSHHLLSWLIFVLLSLAAAAATSAATSGRSILVDCEAGLEWRLSSTGCYTAGSKIMILVNSPTLSSLTNLFVFECATDQRVSLFSAPTHILVQRCSTTCLRYRSFKIFLAEVLIVKKSFCPSGVVFWGRVHGRAQSSKVRGNPSSRLHSWHLVLGQQGHVASRQRSPLHLGTTYCALFPAPFGVSALHRFKKRTFIQPQTTWVSLVYARNSSSPQPAGPDLEDLPCQVIDIQQWTIHFPDVQERKLIF